jgi:16S rRNA (cytidine1402-2'-O)-methyltransferase
VAGLPSDRFVFEGFLPERPTARQTRLRELGLEDRTLIFYEAPHRIQQTLEDMARILGAERRATLARELTKRFETVYHGSLGALASRVGEDEDARRGEIVVVVEGRAAAAASAAEELERVLGVLCGELPLKQAVALAVELTGAPRNSAYRLAVEMNRDRQKRSES